MGVSLSTQRRRREERGVPFCLRPKHPNPIQIQERKEREERIGKKKDTKKRKESKNNSPNTNMQNTSENNREYNLFLSSLQPAVCLRSKQTNPIQIADR
jgi:hypothetical protein